MGRRVEVDYLRPARFNDHLTVACRLETAGRASVVFDQQVKRDDELLLTARVKAACVTVDGIRPAKIPNHLIEHFKNNGNQP